MIYIRCTEQDIQRWNVSGWTWESVLQAYVALEDFIPDVPGDVPSFHGSGSGSNSASQVVEPSGEPNKGNPMRQLASKHKKSSPESPTAEQSANREALIQSFRIRTARPGYVDGVSQRFVAAAVQYGVPLTSDFNDPDGGRHGVGYYYFNIRDGVRDSAALRMLSPLLFQGGKRTGNTGLVEGAAAGNYINGNSHSEYGKGIGKFQLMTYSEVTRVIYEDEVDETSMLEDQLQQTYYKSSDPPSANGKGFGLGGSVKAKGSAAAQSASESISAKGSVSASGGGGGGIRGEEQKFVHSVLLRLIINNRILSGLNTIVSAGGGGGGGMQTL